MNTLNNLPQIRHIGQMQNHPFHVLNSSRLPLFTSLFASSVALLFVAKLHSINYTTSLDYSAAFRLMTPFFKVEGLNYQWVGILIPFFLAALLLTFGGWSYRLTKESTQEGRHTARVQLALKYGMLLFLLSEAALFFPFFWAFFHGALSPAISIGGIWPPLGIKGVEVLDPFALPFVNTVVLLSSGVAVVSAHRAVIFGQKSAVLNMLYLAVSFGLFFSWLQFIEYGLTQFSIGDSLYGSSFFMLTGLHGFHVIVGTVLLIISYARMTMDDFSTQQHVGFETAAWYWHFVDIVWLGVFVFVYIWGV